MRILAFTPFSTMYGGANRSFLMVLRQLSDVYKHEIHVIVPEQGVITDELDKLNITWSAEKFHSIHNVNQLGVKNTAALMLNNLRAFQDRITAGEIAERYNGKFDLIYINDCTAYIGAFVGMYAKKPFVWHFRSNVNPDAYSILGMKRIYRESGMIITISSEMERILLQNRYVDSDVKICKIPNGLPAEKVTRATVNFDNDIHMMLCGRMSPDKGHIDAINTMKIFADNGKKNVYLHIVGSASNEVAVQYENKLKGIIRTYNLEDNIIFEGQIEHMADFRKNMQIELVCSVCEPFGRVTVEGMRSGLVVIGSNTGGTLDIINDRVNGLLYKQGDADDLYAKICSVTEDKAFAKGLSDNAYDFSQNHFTEEENVRKINTVLNEVMNNKRKK